MITRNSVCSALALWLLIAWGMTTPTTDPTGSGLSLALRCDDCGTRVELDVLFTFDGYIAASRCSCESWRPHGEPHERLDDAADDLVAIASDQFREAAAGGSLNVVRCDTHSDCLQHDAGGLR